MTLFQVFLPLYDNAGRPLARERFDETTRELTDTFGGATAFTRSPAEGFWEHPDGGVKKDDMIVVEVMVESIDEEWWSDYRSTLEARFKQETILIRALPCRTL